MVVLVEVGGGRKGVEYQWPNSLKRGEKKCT